MSHVIRWTSLFIIELASAGSKRAESKVRHLLKMAASRANLTLTCRREVAFRNQALEH